jgi:two-component system nitrate/nitrite response regulator NarL
MTSLPNGTPTSAGNSRPRLLIADDDLVVLATLGAQLTADFDVVGTARDGEQAIELARELQPEAALVDVQMPGGGGLRATRGISEACPQTALVILSVDESEESVVEFMNAGAITYLRKGMPATQIASRLHQSIAAHRAFARA